MLPVILMIGFMEGSDIIKEQIHKAGIKNAIRSLFDDDKKLINGRGEIENGSLSIAITPLPPRSASDRQYNVEVYDSDGGFYPRRRLKYDARTDSLRYWKLRHEAGWGF